jgi:TonB-dependent SusC/RagA subfamily outer membrane receptor
MPMKTLKLITRPFFYAFLLFLLAGFAVISLRNDERVNIIVKDFNRYAEKFHQHKIFLHIDRQVYTAGENMWVKAYYLDATKNLPDTTEKIIYIELLRREGTMFATKIFKNTNGFSQGDFTLPDTLREGVYQIRAYTNWLQNFDPDFLFKTDFKVINPKYTRMPPPEYTMAKKNIRKSDGIDCQFFPEGGNLIRGVKTVVGFKATDDLGNPADVAGSIVDNKGKEILKFTSLHDGMGKFTFLPSAKDYKAKITCRGEKYQFNLPKIAEKGIGVMLDNRAKQTIGMSIKQIPAGLTRDVILIGQSNGKIYFSQVVPIKDSVHVDIPKNLFPPGIAQITVFDGESQPRCERLAFISPERVVSGHVSASSYMADRKQRTVLDLDLGPQKQIADGANLSVAVLDAGLNTFETRDHIVSNLYLTSDLKGHIHQPAFYFKDNLAQTVEALDNLLLTQGWRRFLWSDIFSQSPKEPKFPIEKCIYISGRVYKTVMDLSAVNARVSLTILNHYNENFETFTDKKGRFEFLNLEYNDTIDVLLETFNAENKKRFLISVDETESPRMNRKTYYDPGFLDMMKNSRKRDILARSKFRGNQRKIANDGRFRLYDDADAVVNMSDNTSYSSVFQALKGKVPGVNVNDNMGNPSVQIRGPSSIMMSNEPLFLIDGVPVDIASVNMLSPNDVEMIEVLKDPSKAAIYGMRGANGVIAIYTKRGHFINRGELRFKMMGYHAPREFFVPKYDPDEPGTEIFKQTPTIYWNPKVVLDENGKFKAEFVNPSKCAHLRVIVNGISKNGVPVYIEKEVKLAN